MFKSCSSVFGRTLISLTWMTVCFFLASCSRLLVMYLNFPKSMIRQTGGTAIGATSTRSRSWALARWSASDVFTTPNCSPSGPTSRTSGTWICSLILDSLAMTSSFTPSG